jgi:hypothetical protein
LSTFSRAAAGDLEHPVAEGRDQQRHGRAFRHAEGEVHPVLLAGELRRLAAEQRSEHLDVFAHVCGAPRVREPEHPLDQGRMRDADAQREAAPR